MLQIRSSKQIQRTKAAPVAIVMNRSFVRYFTKEHEWVDTETGYTGISPYAANALGDVVYVELPEADMDLSAGETFGTIESVKAASDIYSPVEGIVVEVNEVLEDQTELVNKDPYGSGHIATLEFDHAQIPELIEKDKLMTEKDYELYVDSLEE